MKYKRLTVQRVRDAKAKLGVDNCGRDAFLSLDADGNACPLCPAATVAVADGTVFPADSDIISLEGVAYELKVPEAYLHGFVTGYDKPVPDADKPGYVIGDDASDFDWLKQQVEYNAADDEDWSDDSVRGFLDGVDVRLVEDGRMSDADRESRMRELTEIAEKGLATAGKGLLPCGP